MRERAQWSTEQSLQPLLEALLGELRRARETPLQFGIDSDGIVSVALKVFLAGDAEDGLRARLDWQSATVALDRLVAQFLQPQPVCGRDALDDFESEAGTFSRVVGSNAPDPPGGNAPTHPLAVWLERFYTVMTEVQPRAVEIVTLRVNGFDVRDIAERLGLGLRLVKRIIQDMRTNWKLATGEG
jgi:hypothetical protein